MVVDIDIVVETVKYLLHKLFKRKKIKLTCDVGIQIKVL